jgi:hypothetical protein
MVRTEKQYAKKAAKRLYWIARQKTSLTFFHATVENIQLGKHPRLQGSTIIPRFIAAGLKSECCEACNRTTWNNFPILPILQLHHLNGINNDHRFDNIQFLCPNCHTICHYSYQTVSDSVGLG